MNDTAPDATLDPETRAAHDDHDALRLWLRMLTCTMLVERHIKARLKRRFGMSLPRFDLMAQLERHPQGLRMGELTRRLMVTGGNVTGLTTQLVDEGLIERLAIPGDRRAHAVRLTAKGKRVFDAMAAEHERWMIELFAGLSPAQRPRLFDLLGALKAHLQATESPDTSRAP